MKLESLQIGNLTAKVPVIQGGMGVGVSLSKLAGSVAACGGVGVISTAQIGFREPDFDRNPLGANLRAISKEVGKAREMARGGIVGVNIMVATQFYEEYVKASVKAGADLILSGAGLPMTLPELVKGTAVKIAPIVSGLKATQVICKYWLKKYERLPDLIVAEGPKAGGHLGFTGEQLENVDSLHFEEEISRIVAYVNALAAEQGKIIPVAAAGGIYTRGDAEAAFQTGAKAVQMATRFVTTYECDAPMSYKQAYLAAKEEDIVIVNSPVGMPGRAIRNAFLDRVKKGPVPHGNCHLCVSTCNPAKTPYCITEALINAVTDKTEDALLFCGTNAVKATKLEHVKDIMEEFQ